MSALPNAPATARNRAAILSVLKLELEQCRRLLEIGSGTGQHAAAFAAALPDIDWQTSDLEDNHAAIQAHVDHAGLRNLQAPIALDVRSDNLPGAKYDAVFTANTLHIMSEEAGFRMLSLVSTALREGGSFLTYGPFRVDGRFTSQSNADFDSSLRQQDPDMGIRELSAIRKVAARQGLSLSRTYAMPANNMLLVWHLQNQAL